MHFTNNTVFLKYLGYIVIFPLDKKCNINPLAPVNNYEPAEITYHQELVISRWVWLNHHFCKILFSFALSTQMKYFLVYMKYLYKFYWEHTNLPNMDKIYNLKIHGHYLICLKRLPFFRVFFQTLKVSMVLILKFNVISFSFDNFLFTS